MKTLSSFCKAMAQIMRSRMAFHDITQSEMAEAIGISQSQLSKILRAERTIDLETFEAFCETLGESTADLVKDGESIAERTKETNPDRYQPAAKFSLVEDNTRMIITRTACDE
ncbi:helix-turn-helix protein [Bifidobacterium lemurum]|uniref:Helix-turn-helix protein n=1 Tax=Bifidobacterium lemurum TaxID=1603886 RepID=A0A261FTE3_9BIFI|nr:helix-turn-helix transcriptional regulator [Bifidobacterium lemurum]OZG62429.1 helix-turn-helix protein [Bifidobacterium lemurum]QOL33778.1 helix-turn-helix transcriptional regulator [Bifidobacterium lemurum]